MGAMSSSSPSDLAVTYRSVARRLREALGDEQAPATGVTADLERLLAESGRLVHTTSSPAAIADAIEAVPADGWDDGTLDRLRELALAIGAQLRSIAAAAGDDD